MKRKNLRPRLDLWFHRLLWGVAILFALFLIHLGGLLIGDLPKVERNIEISQFYSQPQYSRSEAKIEELNREISLLNSEKSADYRALAKVRKLYETRHESYKNWLATRAVTQEGEQNPELIKRTEELESLKEEMQSYNEKIGAIDEALFKQRESLEESKKELRALQKSAQTLYYKALEQQEIRVFLYRLMLLLPLLIVAGYLLVKRRDGKYWPFSWGFIFFSLFAFFVELVPYLPSFGGYVRAGVGLLLTITGGIYLIRSYNHYRARQEKRAQLTQEEWSNIITYEESLKHLGEASCPNCARAVNYADPTVDYCSHCGLHLFEPCAHCGVRKNCFAPFCHSCGTFTKEQTVTWQAEPPQE